MNPLDGAARVMTRSAQATVSAAGAVGGAVISGVVGGARGTLTGMKAGLSAGSDSTPAAVLTLAAIGAAGLVEWPGLLGIGGTALVIPPLKQGLGAGPPSLAAVDDRQASANSKNSINRRSASSATSKAKAPARAPRKSATTRRRTPAKK